MRVLVLQHIPIEHPGVFRDFLAADGVAWDTVELDAGEPVPDLGAYGALWVMGGPMDVWEEERHPWLAKEKAVIREAVAARGMPYLGLCLGHQLLAAALGGKVGRMPAPEVGVCDVDLTEEGRRDPLFRALAPRSKALQWHGAEVVEPPPAAVVLASSPACRVQAMRVGGSAYGLQYHVEATGRTVREWAEVPAYAASLAAAMGDGAADRLDRDVGAQLGRLGRDARLVYDGFMRLARPAA